MENKSTSYMNPYLAGFLLGLVLIAAFFVTGDWGQAVQLKAL